MKRTLVIAAIAALFSLMPARALESRQISISAGDSESLDLGFVPSGYKQQTGEDSVTVSLAEGSSTATVVGVKEGKSQIEFPDPSGDGVLLTVDVVPGIHKVLQRLRRQLSDFDGLTLSAGDRKVLIEGTIGNPSDWAKFKRILALDDFAGKTESIVEFSVDPGTIGDLRKEFESEGFSLAAPGAKPEKGQLAMKYEHNVLTLSGNLWSQNDLKHVLSILRSHSWLTIVDKPSEDAATTPIVQAVGVIGVDDSLLELGVAFVVVSKSEATKLESDYDLTLKGVWGGISDFLFGGTRTRQHGKWNDFTINAGLSSSLSMLAENRVSRERQYGTIRFHANGDPGKTLHIGGTLKVIPDASGDGPAPEVQDFEYGFKIVNKNSRRISSDLAEVDIAIEIKGEPYSSELIAGRNTNIRQETRTDSPTVRVPLGKTVAVAGYEHLVETTVPPSGIPLLRHIPILSWFTSSRGESSNDYALLFLVSVRQVDVEGEAPMVENTPMKDITLDANTPNDERIKADREKNARFHGCWTPLNWFTW